MDNLIKALDATLQYQPSEPSESPSQPDYVRNAPTRRPRTPGGQHQIPKEALPVLSRRTSPASSTSGSSGPGSAVTGPAVGPALGGGVRQMAPIVESLLEPADSLNSSARLFKPRVQAVNGSGTGNGSGANVVVGAAASGNKPGALPVTAAPPPQHKRQVNELVDALLESDGGCGASIGEVFDDEDERGPVGTNLSLIALYGMNND